MTNKNHYFIYPEDKNGDKTGHTICILMGTDPRNKLPRAYYGIAICSEKDQFSYDVGRKLAYERALEAEEKRKASNELISI